MRKTIIETERLLLREFTTDDAPFIVALLNSPGWLEYIGDRNVRTKEQAVAYLQNGPIKSYRENGFGLSMVERKKDGAQIGMCGLIKRDFLEHPDIGFALMPGFEGKGYAYEIASAVMEYGRSTLGIDKVCAIVLPANTRSVSLLEKLGMRRVSTVIYPGSNEELALFSN